MDTTMQLFDEIGPAGGKFQLSYNMKSEVVMLAQLFEAVEQSDKPVRHAIKLIAEQYQSYPGFDETTLVAKFYKWRRGGHDWKVLVNKKKLSNQIRSHLFSNGKQKQLPIETQEFFRGLCEKYQRNTAPAYREFVRLYFSGQPIPGLGCRPTSASSLPSGCSYRSMIKYAPSKFELKVRRIGRSAASEYRPLVYTTRVGLKVGQFIMFDDVEHDHKVIVPGVNQKPMRPLELGCLDVFSGYKIAWGIKPTMLDEITQAKQKLKSVDMRFLVAFVLYNSGYRPDGTTLVLERGTATLGHDLERDLHDATDGAIMINRAGLASSRSFAGAFDSAKRGNSRFKASLEAHHSLVHNEMAALPGQMGKDRDSAPEEMAGADRYQEMLMNVCSQLPVKYAELIQHPYMTIQEFRDVAGEVYKRINERTEHGLEGWEEAQLMVKEFRLLAQNVWLPMAILPHLRDDERKAIEAIIDQPGCLRCRKMSPAEVWNNGCKDLVKIHASVLPSILGPDLGIDRKVQDSAMFEFQDKDLGPGTWRYIAQVETPQGRIEALKRGETYLTHVNPFDPKMMLVSAPKGGFLGVARLHETIRRDDVEALKEAFGKVKAVETELLKGVEQRGLEESRRRLALRQNNVNVVRKAMKADKAAGILANEIETSEADLAAVLSNGEQVEPAQPYSAEEISELLRTTKTEE